MEIPPETIPITVSGLLWVYIRARARSTGRNSEPPSVTNPVANPLAIDPRVNWARVSILEKRIFGYNSHHGFGVQCHCDVCRAEANEKIARKSVAIAKAKEPTRGPDLFARKQSWYDRALQLMFRNGFQNHQYAEHLLSAYITGQDISRDPDVPYVYEVISQIGPPPVTLPPEQDQEYYGYEGW